MKTREEIRIGKVKKNSPVKKEKHDTKERGNEKGKEEVQVVSVKGNRGKSNDRRKMLAFPLYLFSSLGM